MAYEVGSNLYDMFANQPILTTCLFGVPAAFFAIIAYSVCSSDFSVDRDEIYPHDEDEEDASDYSDYEGVEADGVQGGGEVEGGEPMDVDGGGDEGRALLDGDGQEEEEEGGGVRHRRTWWRMERLFKQYSLSAVRALLLCIISTIIETDSHRPNSN